MRKSAGIGLLISPDDREELQALLAQLNRRGLRVSERNDAAGKDDIVLAVLSEAFYKEKDLTDRLLGLIGAGADKVLPLQLDDAPIPERLKNALYARNIIPTAGRDASLIAERIVSALPRKKSRLPLVLAAAGLVLVALVGFLIWRSAAGGEKLPAMAGEGPIVGPSALGITEEDLASIENVVIVGEQIVSSKTMRSRDLRQTAISLSSRMTPSSPGIILPISTNGTTCTGTARRRDRSSPPSAGTICAVSD